MDAAQAGDGGGLSTVGIDDLTKEGVGLGRMDGRVVLVEGGIPGDLVDVRLGRRTRQHVVGKLVKLREASPDRRHPPCILADRCGGCTLQSLSDSAQQRWKSRTVQETIQRISRLPVTIEPLLAAPEALGYRNRAVIPLERESSGRLRAGYYRRGSHQIVNMNHCPVLDPRLDAMIGPLKADLEASGWPVDRHGVAGSPGAGLRHLALRIGPRRGQRLITLIASHGDLPGLATWAERWMARWPEVVGVSLNLQPLGGNRLFGDETLTIGGADALLEPFAGVELQIAPDTFFQVYSAQAERVVELLRKALGQPRGRIVEGFCGIGTFSLPLAQGGWSVLGMEQHARTVELARANARLNGLSDRCRFEMGDVARLLGESLEVEQPTAVLLDPPRKGLQEVVVANLLRHLPPQILYLSCDPATLARDLGRLCAQGNYAIAGVQPLDFFPNTTHVECLAVLRRPDQEVP